ncbi:hypothetical protein CDAR_556241 [Caerostris darwini]|uniref:Uncharacterized protein n=1 Tax=Caerostris darwini TaxID=1538125 RepID=A0AAV4MFZ4_9ARAC|nr:hypothetical protein CDAR_556241 [Caerostris darwini]
MHFRDYIVSHSRRERINCAHLPPLMDQLGTQLPPEAPGVVHRELLLPQHICPQSTATSTLLNYIVSHSRREQINCAHLPPLMHQLGTQLPPEASGVVHRELLLPQHICPQSTATSTPLSNYTNGRT